LFFFFLFKCEIDGVLMDCSWEHRNTHKFTNERV